MATQIAEEILWFFRSFQERFYLLVRSLSYTVDQETKLTATNRRNIRMYLEFIIANSIRIRNHLQCVMCKKNSKRKTTDSRYGKRFLFAALTAQIKRLKVSSVNRIHIPNTYTTAKHLTFLLYFY